MRSGSSPWPVGETFMLVALRLGRSRTGRCWASSSTTSLRDSRRRPGGYTRVLKLGHRKGDAAEMALIELVERVDA
jgi:hypothetical protein